MGSEPDTFATLDGRELREAPTDAAAEARGIGIGMCLAAAMMVRDFDNQTYAAEILGAAGIDHARLLALNLDEYDADPLLKLLEAANG